MGVASLGTVAEPILKFKITCLGDIGKFRPAGPSAPQSSMLRSANRSLDSLTAARISFVVAFV